MKKFQSWLRQHSSQKILIAVLLLAFFLRIVDINDNPRALYGDELTIAYDAYSLLKTAHDQTGALLPLTLTMGDGRPGGYVYGSIPLVALFGPTALGVRLLSVISGVGIVYLLYLLGRRLFNSQVGLIAAFFGAISPWEIALSRGGFEAHFALFLALAGVVSFLSAKNWRYYLLSAICFGLTLHTYPTYKLVLPFFLLLLFWLDRKRLLTLPKKFFVVPGLVFLILVILAMVQTFTGDSERRFLNINIFSQAGFSEQTTQTINQERNDNTLPPSIAALFHNRFAVYPQTLIESYLENLSMDFLFTKGDQNPRHNPATMGELLYAQMILIFLGLGFLWRRSKFFELALLVGWILVAPISTTLLLEPHVLRNAFMLPPLLIITALGLAWLLESRQNQVARWGWTISLAFLIIQLTFFINQTYFVAANKYDKFWSYPAKQAAQLASQEKNHYSYIFLSEAIDNIYQGYLVYNQIDPKLVQQNLIPIQQINGANFKKFDNVYIGSVPDTWINDFLKRQPGSYLYIDVVERKKNLTNYRTINNSVGDELLVVKSSDKI